MLHDILFMLIGAGLMAAGYLTAALAECLRSFHAEEPCELPSPEEKQRSVSQASDSLDQPAMPRARTVTRNVPKSTTNKALPPTIDQPPEMPRTPTITRAARSEAKTTTPGNDVIAALVAFGYKRTIAAEATWNCNVTERGTIEDWTAAALRRCAVGGVA